MSAAKKAKITTVFPDKIDGVDKPLLQTLATVCQKLYDEELYTSFSLRVALRATRCWTSPTS